MEEEVKKSIPNEYSAPLEAADEVAQKTTDTYAEAAKLKEALVAKKKDFEEMTKKNLNNMLTGKPEVYSAADLLKISEEIKEMDAKIKDLTRLADAGSDYVLKLDDADKGMLDKLKKMESWRLNN